jgi:hypothetical protein
MSQDFVLCRSCKARIVFAWTATGARMPLNAEPSSDGTFFVFWPPDVARIECEHHLAVTERATKARRASRPRRLPHFATCPNAAIHSKPKEESTLKTLSGNGARAQHAASL